ncbi:MAC/Perforin domain-containing protein [Perilla frutescens var. hirtella]|nr:MAC/Perforin domain-containing protein [Perilla frutescens var. hirtella]
MDTMNCCSGCAGVDYVYSCLSPVRRASVVPSHAHVFNAQPVAVAVKKEENVTRGNAAAIAAMPKATVAVKKEIKEEVVKARHGAWVGPSDRPALTRADPGKIDATPPSIAYLSFDFATCKVDSSEVNNCSSVRSIEAAPVQAIFQWLKSNRRTDVSLREGLGQNLQQNCGGIKYRSRSVATLCNSIQGLGRGFDVTSDIRLLYYKGAPGSRLVNIDDHQTRNLQISESSLIPNVSVDIECSRGRSFKKEGTPVLSFREVMN